MTLRAIKAGEKLIPLENVDYVTIDDIESEHAVVVTKSGECFSARGFDAIEAVMALKPSALEGRRLKWHKHAWAFHNMVGHPVMQIMVWLGFKKAAIRFHDYTTPTPRAFKEKKNALPEMP